MYGAETLPAITTGKDLVTVSKKMMTVKDAEMDEGKPKGVLAGSLGSLAKSMSLLVQSNLLQNEILLSIKDAILGTPSERRDEKIGAGDTDKPKGPGILSRVGSTLSKLNPFGGGGFMDTLLKLGLAVGGIALLKIFGDDMVPHLANMIKAFKEGTIGEKISEIVTDIQEYLTPLWIKIKEKVGDFIIGVQTVFTLIEGAYKSIKDYIMQYDTQGEEHPAGAQHGEIGDGKLDDEEKGKMVEDIVTKISESIWSVSKSILTTLLQAFTLYTVSKIALTTLMGLALRTGAPLLALGGATVALGVAAIAAIVATGVWKLANNMTTAWEDAVTDELGNKQDFSLKEFTTRLLVGKTTGNKIQDVMQNAYDKMFVGAATGATIGGFMGAGVFSIPAAGFGAVIGALSGITIGAVTAYYGEDVVNDKIDKLFGEGSSLMKSLDIIYNAYEMLILRPWEYVFGKLGTKSDSFLARLGYDFDAMKDGPKSKEDLYGADVNSDKLAKKSTAELTDILNKNKKLRDDLQPKRNAINIPLLGEFNIGAYDKNLTGDEQTDLRGYKEVIKQIEKELLERGINIDTGEYESKEPTIQNSQFIMDKYIANKLKEMRVTNIVPDPKGSGGFMFNKQNSDNKINNAPNYMFGGIGPYEPMSSTVILKNPKVHQYKRKSDIQLKEDIKLEGKSPSDINIYSFKYKGEEGRYEGVMAQEVPWASLMGDNGYLMVDYSKLDVEFKRIN